MPELNNVFRNQLLCVQTCVEDLVDVKLGKVRIAPFSEAQREYHRHRKSIFGVDGFQGWFRRGMLSLMVLVHECIHPAQAGQGTVYYSRNPKFSRYSESDMMHMLAHEVVHIAHQRLAKKVHFDLRCPREVQEGFADYVSTRVMREMGLDPFSEVDARGYLAEFRRVLLEKGFADSVAGAKAYALSYDQQA